MSDSLFSSFLNVISRPRRLRGGWGAGLIQAAASRGFVSRCGVPRVIRELPGAEEIEVPSFSKGGSSKGYSEVCELIGQSPPSDFVSFLENYGESLIVTQAAPVHIYGWEEIFQQIMDNTLTSRSRKPRRFFRFAGAIESDHEYYGLRQVSEGDEWEVVAVAQQPDEFLEGASDFGEYEYYQNQEVPPAIAPSFTDWLEDLIAYDGLKEPYLDASFDGPVHFEPI